MLCRPELVSFWPISPGPQEGCLVFKANGDGADGFAGQGGTGPGTTGRGTFLGEVAHMEPIWISQADGEGSKSPDTPSQGLLVLAC